MVKSGEERAAKYQYKYDPEAIRLRFSATKDLATTKQASKQEQLANIAQQVRALLNQEGVPPVFTISFLSFANKLYAITNKFSGEAAKIQAEGEYKKWITMTSPIDPDQSILKQIWNLFSAVLPPKA